jgi:hypothetical protein
VALNKKFAAIAGGVTAIGATVALTAGTFSYFTDSGSVDRAVNFGTLDLNLQQGAAKNITIDHAAPGQTVLPTTAMTFYNSGDMDGVVRIRFVPTHAPETSKTLGAAAAYDEAILVTLDGVSDLPVSDRGNNTYSLRELKEDTASGLYLATLSHGGKKDDYAYKGFGMSVSIDPEAGNVLQGVSGGFKIEADLVQTVNGGFAGVPFVTQPVTQP